MENSGVPINYEGRPAELAVRRDVSEHDRAEAELSFQIEVMKHMPCGVMIARTSDGVMVYANSVFEEWFGYGPGELAGKHVSIINVSGEKSAEAVAREIIAILNEQGAWKGEIHNIKKDGTPFWSFVSISTFEHHEYGKVWVSIQTDITERKRMEEDIYRKLYDNAPDMLASIDPNTAKIIQCNQTVATALGYTKEELVGRSIFEIYHPGSIDRAKEAFCSFVKTGSSRAIELQLERKDGSTIDISLNISAIRDEQGNIIYQNLIWHDITERKQTEEALRDNEERYKLILAGADAAIWDWDVPAKRVLFSPRWKELRGLSDDEVSDHEQEWSSRIHPDDFDRMMAAVRAHFEGRTPVFAEEYRVRHKDGRWIWILDRGIARRDAAGRVVRMAGSETDITERKQAEEALRESERRLATLVSNLPGMAYRYRNDRNRTMEFVSDGVTDITGFAPADFTSGRIHWAQLQHPDDVEWTWNEVRSAAREDRPFKLEYRIRHKDGSERWVWEQGQGISNEKNEVIAFEGFVTNITERKQGEEGRAQLAAIVESSDVAIFSRDLDGVITSGMLAQKGFMVILLRRSWAAQL